MNRLLAFLNDLDARAWRTVWVSAALVAVTVALFVIGRMEGVGLAGHIEGLTASLRSSPWGPLAVIALFCAGAFLFAPQFVLIGAAVVAFGPVEGAGYAWVATLISGTLTFFAGRLGGSDLVRRFGGERVNRLSRFIGRNDFLASLVVRNVPTAPFVVVNMVFGASHARFWLYLAGLSIGAIPKIVLVALVGQSAAAAIGGAPLAAGALLLSVFVIWLTAALAARKAVRPERDDAPARGEGPPAPPTSP